jgi:hypothetical protein
MATPKPFLTLNDLGVELEGDSGDLLDEEVLSAVDTEDTSDFETQLTAYLLEERESSNFEKPHYDRRVRTGIYYCRVSLGTTKKIFRLPWMRKS